MILQYSGKSTNAIIAQIQKEHGEDIEIVSTYEKDGIYFMDVQKEMNLQSAYLDYHFVPIGFPGCGKTSSILKMATKFYLDGEDFEILTMDCQKKGAVAQISQYAKIFNKKAHVIYEPKHITKYFALNKRLLIDTPGINPNTDISLLKEIALYINTTFIYEAYASCDPDVAALLNGVCKKFILSKTDITCNNDAIVAFATKTNMSLIGAFFGPNATNILKQYHTEANF